MKLIKILTIAILTFFIISCDTKEVAKQIAYSEYKKLQNEYKNLKTKYDDLLKENKELKQKLLDKKRKLQKLIE
jgi:predicted nuclease with TOPRIM domain